MLEGNATRSLDPAAAGLGMTVSKVRRLPSRRSQDSRQTAPLINRRLGNRRSLSLALTPENNEDAGEEGDDSWNKAEVESEHCN